MSWRYYNRSVKKYFSTFPKVILHDKPIKPIVTKNVNTTTLGTNQCSKVSDTGSGRKNDTFYGILLDGKLLHTPKGKVFSCSNKFLLPLLVNEWNGVLGKLHRFRSLPITYCLSSHIDNKDVSNVKLLNYFEHDTLKYLPFLSNITYHSNVPNTDNYYPLKFEFLKSISKFSFEEYSTIALSQYLNCLSFQTTTLSSDVSKYIDKLTSLDRVVMEMLSDEYKSFILASSVLQEAISPEIALRLSRIEETYQKSTSIKNVENVDSVGNLQLWLEHWQEEELDILRFVKGVFVCANSRTLE
ncbi:hypothetical protein BmR1_04g07395 [Babesia microti strain RI]|uniref:ATP synthase mitochondrial F1 complex assembly factor 2 n=1 Tax=Babesia microti (strain RI) TaxID=1133968 RepID=I7JDA0_BABMR|nr:hypothetical protein BmR1_04g07395 [Babesia microti strain RI]CCF75670.1 hypothetical protein BmR1_04g07395 [Babesia microti strain RI]|eukprot:XP_012650078.1 hypothetical protein BmR1_04g07395 [Babesia microti strain RI]